MQQPELAFYEAKAKNQDAKIIEIFEKLTGKWATPFHIQSMYKASTGIDIPITSVRRSISNLTKEGKLLKSSLATVKGAYNMRNHTWTISPV